MALRGKFDSRVGNVKAPLKLAIELHDEVVEVLDQK
jgi:hypothetical protein